MALIWFWDIGPVENSLILYGENSSSSVVVSEHWSFEESIDPIVLLYF